MAGRERETILCVSAYVYVCVYEGGISVSHPLSMNMSKSGWTWGYVGACVRETVLWVCKCYSLHCSIKIKSAAMDEKRFLLKIHSVCLYEKVFFFFFSLLLAVLWWVFVTVCGFSLVMESEITLYLQCAGFSLWWILLQQSMGSRYMSFSRCGSWAPQHWLSNCGAWAYLLCSMWDLPGPGIELVPSVARQILFFNINLFILIGG